MISFAAGDMPNPARSLPRATYIALGITTALYIVISLGVFGSLTVESRYAGPARRGNSSRLTRIG